MRVIISIYFTPAETRAINVFECIYSCRILANPEPVQCKIVIIHVKHPRILVETVIAHVDLASSGSSHE